MRLLFRQLRDRRDRAVTRAETLGSQLSGDAGTLDQRTALETALDDVERSERILAATVQVRSEPLVYEPWRSDRSFFRDMVAARSDNHAQERLERHQQEMLFEVERRDALAMRNAKTVFEGRGIEFEVRDVSRVDGAGGEFVPPLWLIDRFATAARASRPLANLVGPLPLPRGTDSIKVPRVTTGASTAPQTTDNAAVNETDMATTSASMPVVTIAGRIDAAQQVVDQTPGAAFDLIALKELTSDYDANLESQLWAGTGANGELQGLLGLSGITTGTYTDASPTVPELQAIAGKAAGDASTSRKLPVTHAFTHPRRWFWIASGSDTATRPFVPPTDDPSEGPVDGRVGRFVSLPTYVDAAIPTDLGAGTNEDRVVMTRPADHLLLESSPRLRLLLAPGSGTLTAQFQLYAYVAWTGGLYPAVTAVVGGTGLVAPT